MFSLEVDQDDDNAFSRSWDAEGPTNRDVKEIIDLELANLRVQELTKLLWNVPWEEAARISNDET